MAQKIYEAEEATVFGADIKDYRSGASNAYVDYANNSGDYIEWSVFRDTAGSAEVSFRYALGAGAARPLQLNVNGETQSELLDFASTGSWDQWQSVVNTLQLKAGENTIRLEAAGQSGPNIDYMAVEDAATDTVGGGDGGATPFEMLYEAEDAVIVGADIKNYREGASGSYVDYANNTGDSIEWTVDVNQAGGYELAFQYALAGGTPRALQLSINGQVQPELIDFSGTGGWDQWQAIVKTLNLDAGVNTIKLLAVGDSGPNVDFLKVTSGSTGGGGTPPSGGGGTPPSGGNGNLLDVMINFQNNSNDIPDGYVKDYGQAYDGARGYGWITEASAASGGSVPLDILTSGRDRNITGYDQRLDTFVHMEDTNFSAAWEYALANGTYAVTVSVGDGLVDDNESRHSVNVEGQSVIDNFMGTMDRAYAVETAVVTVNDGKLTIDSIGGTKTKINFVEIEAVDVSAQPEIAAVSPQNDAVNVSRSEAIAFDVSLKEVGVGVDGASLTNATVSLYATNGFSQVQGNLNTSGGGDTIIFKPAQALEANTDYTLVLDGVTDANGTEFVPYTTSFTTGTQVDVQEAQHSLSVVAERDMAISLMISPDDTQLYATTVDGKIVRWNINQETGALSNKQTFLGLQDDPNAPAAIIGMAFDPNDPNTLWVSHNASYYTHADDFTGQISKLHLQDGADFNPTVEEYIVGLPRSNHDHMTNSLSFGPDGNLYVTQGGNTAMGALDTAWGDRPERELTASMLKIDPTVDTNGTPINVQTENFTREDGTQTFGSYDPFAPNAPVTIYATGLRNAYDHVWHSNGELYVPDNGSAAGGVVPDDPDTPINEYTTSVHSQHDVLYQVEEGFYYGHPNASRGEYILRGGNPTAGEDPGEVSARNGFKGYQVGVMPEDNYQTHVFDFGDKQSANGIIELKTGDYGNAFQNSLLVVRYSAGNDIVSIQLDAQGNVVDSAIFASDMVNPLDLIEHGPSGRIYVAEFRGFESKISMFTPEGNGSGTPPDSTPPPPTTPSGNGATLGVYEAEDAAYTGPVFKNHHEGFTGDGFLDFTNTVDDYIEWTVSGVDAGMYHLDFRYALANGSRPLDVYINNQLAINNLDFSATGGWNQWQNAGLDAQLQDGTNTIRLEADGSSGGNIDSLIISEFA